MSAPDHDLEQLRVPPHSVEAEQSVLGGLLLDNRAWDRAADQIKEGDFYRQEHRLIFAAMSTMLSASKPADVITVFERLKSAGQAEDIGGLGYLNALAQSVPSAANMRRYAEIVRERATLRRLIAATSDAATLAWQASDPGEALDRITTIFGELQRHQVRKAPRLIADIALERTRYYEALEGGRAVAGWPTHIPTLDKMLNGGLRPGGLYILAARPSVGKSSLAQGVALNMAADGQSTLFLSLEMGENEVADRGVSCTGRVSYSALQTGRMAQDDWSRAVDALDRLGPLPLHIDDQGAITLRDVRSKAKLVPGLRLIVIDYLQLMSGSSRRDGNRNAEIEEISRGLKALAKELGVAILALSQLNRSVETRNDKRPNLSDLRDSGAIEQDADVVLFLWPVRDFDNEGRRLVGMSIGKNRQGRLGEFGLDFHGDIQRWAESTADIRQAAAPRNRGADL